MTLALVAILTVIFGLLVQKRAQKLARATSSMTRAKGRRSAAFGGLIAAAATPWVVIGITLAHIA